MDEDWEIGFAGEDDIACSFVDWVEGEGNGSRSQDNHAHRTG